MKPRGLTKPSMSRTAAIPRKAGSIIENLNGSSCAFFGSPSSSTSVISLLFGLASSTLLTVLVIPAIYVVLRDANQVLQQG
jgi:hypothetical protein